MLRNLVSLMLLMALSSVSALADESHKGLSRKELHEIFTGNTAIGQHLQKNLQIKDYYGKKGHFVSLRSDGQKLTGKWWVSKHLDLLCLKYKHIPDKSFCRTVIKSAKGGFDKIRRKDGKVLVHYEQLVPGNQTKSK